MKKLLLFAAVAGLGLVSASPPDKGPEPEARTARHYPPCSPTVRDSCIQLHERGVRRHDQHARGEHRGHGDRHAHREHRVHREHAAADHRPARPLARAARASRQVAQRVRRAGERG